MVVGLSTHSEIEYNSGIVIAGLDVLKDYSVRFTNFSAEAGKEHEMGLLRPVLEKMGKQFSRGKLNGTRVNDLMDKLMELKEAISE